MDKTLVQSATLCLVLYRRERSKSGAYWVYELDTKEIVARHQIVSAMLPEDERRRIYEYVNGIDSGATVLEIEDPTPEQQKELEATMSSWEEELEDEERRIRHRLGESREEVCDEGNSASSDVTNAARDTKDNLEGQGEERMRCQKCRTRHHRGHRWTG